MTVVMARPWVVVATPVAAVVEATSVLLASSAPSSDCWAADGDKKKYISSI